MPRPPPRTSIDAAIRAKLERLATDPARLLAAANNHQPKDTAREMVDVEKELRRLDNRVEKLTRLCTKGLIEDADAERQLAEVARLRSTHRARLVALEAERNAAGA